MSEAPNDIHPLLPGAPAPDLTVPLAGGGTWRLHDQTPERFLLIVVYRGLHCPLCRRMLEDWNGRVADLAAKGVQLFCVSADPQDRAEQSAADWEIGNLALGYGWDLAQARSWGLYISSAIKEKEPRLFLEPGFFLLDADFTVHSISVQSMPYARPQVADIVSGLDYVLEKDYPPRGTVGFIEDRSADLDLSSAAGG